MALTTRNAKGSPLTFSEMDANLTGLADGSLIAVGAITYATIQQISATNRLLGRKTAAAGQVEEITVGGDISQSGSTFTIGAGAVSYSKIQNISATGVLLGRKTAGAGVTEEITPAGDLTLSGSTFTLATNLRLTSLLTAKGSLVGASAANTPVEIPVGSAGSIPMARSAATPGLAYVAALNKAIYGFTYANNGGDSIDIAAGGAMDSTGAYWITGAALTKSITATWVVGNAQGMLDTGSVGNSDYYIWAIARSDTGIVDYLASLSSTAPTMPTNYDFKRLIGWFKRVGGANVAFSTFEIEGGGIELQWTAPTLDVNLSNTLTTSRRTDAIKVPLNFSVLAHITVDVTDVSIFAIRVCCPDETDAAPSGTAAPLFNVVAPTGGVPGAADFWLRTSAAGLIGARANIATVDTYCVSTLGFRWARRN